MILRYRRALTLFVTALGLALPTVAGAERHSAESTSVSVTYQISLPKSEDAAKTDANTQAARTMVYQRVKQECIDMKKYIAKTCKLSKLDIRQTAGKRRNRDQADHVNIQASAHFRITLSDEMQ